MISLKGELSEPLFESLFFSPGESFFDSDLESYFVSQFFTSTITLSTSETTEHKSAYSGIPYM